MDPVLDAVSGLPLRSGGGDALPSYPLAIQQAAQIAVAVRSRIGKYKEAIDASCDIVDIKRAIRAEKSFTELYQQFVEDHADIANSLKQLNHLLNEEAPLEPLIRSVLVELENKLLSYKAGQQLVKIVKRVCKHRELRAERRIRTIRKDLSRAELSLLLHDIEHFKEHTLEHIRRFNPTLKRHSHYNWLHIVYFGNPKNAARSYHRQSQQRNAPIAINNVPEQDRSKKMDNPGLLGVDYSTFVTECDKADIDLMQDYQLDRKNFVTALSQHLHQESIRTATRGQGEILSPIDLMRYYVRKNLGPTYEEYAPIESELRLLNSDHEMCCWKIHLKNNLIPHRYLYMGDISLRIPRTISEEVTGFKFNEDERSPTNIIKAIQYQAEILETHALKFKQMCVGAVEAIDRIEKERLLYHEPPSPAYSPRSPAYSPTTPVYSPWPSDDEATY